METSACPSSYGTQNHPTLLLHHSSDQPWATQLDSLGDITIVWDNVWPSYIYVSNCQRRYAKNRDTWEIVGGIQWHKVLYSKVHEQKKKGQREAMSVPSTTAISHDHEIQKQWRVHNGG